jgi:DNA-binding CsgD family transcriptional regulator
MNLSQDLSTLDVSAADPAAGAYGAGYDQLHATVQQLVFTAMARAQQELGLRMPHGGMPSSRSAAKVRLSEREHEVLRCVAAGDSNKVIARALGLSPHTVKRHVANVLGKTNARSRGQAVAWLLSQP